MTNMLACFQACLTEYECPGEAAQAHVRCYMRNSHRPPCGAQQHTSIERLAVFWTQSFFFCVSVKLWGSGDGWVATSASVCLACRQTGSRAAADDGLCVRGPSGSHGFSLGPLLCQSPLPLSLLSFLLAPSLAASSSATSLPHMK